jgi:hypothetical protein
MLRVAFHNYGILDAALRIRIPIVQRSLDANEFRKICPSFNERQVIQKPALMSSILKTVIQALDS